MQVLQTLQIVVNHEYPELVQKYKESIIKHNKMVTEHVRCADSGFDLFFPEDVHFFNTNHAAKLVSFQLKARMKSNIKNNDTFIAFAIYPRSSISKTPLMLANHVGVIDSSYRGNLIGAFRSFVDNYLVEKHTRLLQICHPGFEPFLVEMIDSLALDETERGSGGFGSTGV
jgi:dUTPase